jgi:hypothetical protein
VREREESHIQETDNGEKLELKGQPMKGLTKRDAGVDNVSLPGYQHRICKQQGLEKPEDITRFKKWAFENTPWRE